MKKILVSFFMAFLLASCMDKVDESTTNTALTEADMTKRDLILWGMIKTA